MLGVALTCHCGPADILALSVAVALEDVKAAAAAILNKVKGDLKDVAKADDLFTGHRVKFVQLPETRGSGGATIDFPIIDSHIHLLDPNRGWVPHERATFQRRVLAPHRRPAGLAQARVVT